MILADAVKVGNESRLARVAGIAVPIHGNDHLLHDNGGRVASAHHGVVQFRSIPAVIDTLKVKRTERLSITRIIRRCGLVAAI